MTGHLIYTCPHCRAIVDYSCMCEVPRSIAEYVGHATVNEAKAAVTSASVELNRRDNVACMASEPDNGDRFY